MKKGKLVLSVLLMLIIFVGSVSAFSFFDFYKVVGEGILDANGITGDVTLFDRIFAPRDTSIPTAPVGDVDLVVQYIEFDDFSDLNHNYHTKKVTIKNIGTENASAFRVKGNFYDYLSSGISDGCWHNFGGLGAGENVSFSCGLENVYTTEATNNNVSPVYTTFNVTVDVYDQVTETDEYNNVAGILEQWDPYNYPSTIFEVGFYS